MVQESIYIQIIVEEMEHTHLHTPMQTDSTMAEGVIKSTDQNTQKQWICDSIGYKTEDTNNNSNSIGNQANKIMPITGPSITW